MPVNATPEYFKAEAKFLAAKTNDEKILALEEMISLLPKHHGSEKQLAQLKSKLSKLRKEAEKHRKKIGSKIGIQKEGEAQVCLIGFTNSGKSFLLSKITDAKPEVAEHPYTTIKPEIGMMDYNGIKIQIVEIPSTFNPEYMSVARSAELIALVTDNNDKRKLIEVVNDFNIRKFIFINPFLENMEAIKQKIWRALGLMIVYTKRGNKKSPMALPIDSTVRDFTERIHKDFLEGFRFARLWRNYNGKERTMQVGLDYILQNEDVVEIHTK